MKVSPLSPPNPGVRQSPDGEPFKAPRGVGAVKRSREDVDPQIREAAEGLEAMFLNTMMQAMRNTVQESEFSLENPATKIYRGMLDTEVAQQTARNNSVGLADQVIAYLEQRGYNSGKAPVHGRTKPVADSDQTGVKTGAVTNAKKEVSSEVRTGGTDES